MPARPENAEDDEVPRVFSRYREVLREAHGLRKSESNSGNGEVFWPGENGTQKGQDNRGRKSER